jgi:hypothetical protein
MKIWKLAFFALLFCAQGAYAKRAVCPSDVTGYKVVQNSVFPFKKNGRQECFFAFYAANSDRSLDAHGSGNPGESIWYARFRPGGSVTEFGRPSRGASNQDWLWQDVCDIDAVSFVDINGDRRRDVTVIGTCLKSARMFRRYFVFLRNGDNYVLDEKTLHSLLGHNSLEIADVKKFSRTGVLQKNAE